MAKELLPDALWLRIAPLIAGSAETEGRTAPCVGPGSADRDPVRAEDGHPPSSPCLPRWGVGAG